MQGDATAWLIETDGPYYLYVNHIGGANIFQWTRDANKALRFSRREDADAAFNGLRVIERKLFEFPTMQAVKPVEHRWLAERAGQGQGGDRG